MSSSTSGKSSSSKVKSLGEYLLFNKKLIGKGQFAEVYEGIKRNNDHPVAIKIIQRSRLNDKLMSSLELETNIMRKIEHPNIIRLFAVHRSKRHFYLVMEKCSGGELSTFLRRNKKPLDAIVVKKFLCDLAKGLRCLWELNLVHRDLKPANLLLDCMSVIDPVNPLSKLGTLKIADFGFAREIGPGSMAETMCGSPLYMAPEILTFKKYDAKADLWSVGIILYEMLYGSTPFRADNVLSLINAIERTHPSMPLTKNVDQQAVNLLVGLLQKDPANRLSFEEFYSHPYLGLGPIHSDANVSSNVLSAVETSPAILPNQPVPIIPISPTGKLVKPPKTSPFVGATNLEYSAMHASQSSSGDDLSADKAKTKTNSMSSMVTMTKSGHIDYPSVIFDFTQLKCNNPTELDSIVALEKVCKRAWAVGECGYLMDKYNKQMEGLCVYVRALDLLQNIIGIASKSECERGTAILMWCRSCFLELNERADKLYSRIKNASGQYSNVGSLSSSGGSIGTTNGVYAENILYKYALKLAKESAYNEYLSDTNKWQQCANMYTRSMLVFEFLIEHSDIGKSDRDKLQDFVQQFEKRIKHAEQMATEQLAIK
ncbi:autophagy-related protein ATG1 [Acrasis kona]|uniref:Autophagy-related protein ATG1 n=1 Tax=Acrasis kona TaxID=1008807 RepID=A0AAW2Z7D0_9EUKA